MKKAKEKPIFRNPETVITRNGKKVTISTKYVPYPMGRGWETMVFVTNRNGVKYDKVLDEGHYGESEYAAKNGHTKMCQKWLKGVA